MSSPLTFAQRSLRSALPAIATAAAVTIALGTILLTLAVTMHVASVEIEQATPEGAADTVDDATASEGGALQFGIVGGSPPPPADGGTDTPPPPAPGDTGVDNTAAIIFEDDFNGPAGSLPDQSKWGDYSTCSEGPVAAWGLIRCGDDEKLDGSGNLVLPAAADYGTGLQTKGKFTFMYGTVSAWIKMPKEVGYWPAFWLVNPKPGVTGVSGEIDIVEAYTTWPTLFHATTHSWDSGQVWSSPDELCGGDADLSQAFHKYTAKIEPHKITFFFDDKQCGQPVVPAMAGGKPWPFGPDNTDQHHIIFDLAVGGAAGQQQPVTAPGQMVIDRVEVREN
ncbi:glycoside hydrolase family 16 protein [Candidatus Saccharibacteria bacterium]|nr:glycoside hydrolase family 16 protein [Candidatus Saccharibacteria bacterium]